MPDRSSMFAAGEDLRRLCWVYVRRYPPSDREDLIQDALLAVLVAERAGRVHDIDAAYDVARLRIFNRWRAGRRYNIHVGLQYERLRLRRGNPHGIHHGRIEHMDMPVYLGVLTPRERKAIEMRLWGGLTSAEAGEVLDMTPSAVKNLYLRAVQRLRKRFGDQR